MGENSKIEWTEHTFNPWWGCTKIDPGCEHCYAERMSRRWKRAEWGPEGKRIRTSEAYWKQPLKWNRQAEEAGESARVFCGSMCDVFDDHESIPIDELYELMGLVESTPNLDWMFLTKRALNCQRFFEYHKALFNLWLGVSVCDQKGDVRIEPLLRTPAAQRFLSVEPLLERVEIFHDALKQLDLVIVGCESGPGARPMDLDWVRDIRDQCLDAGTHFFFKQAMERGKIVKTPELDGWRWDKMPPRRKLKGASE